MSTQDSLSIQVFDRLPYGVAIVDAGGGLVRWNDAAQRMLPALDRDGAEPRCDELLDCRRPGGPCERGCLAARAADAGEALPEIRIDAAPGAGTSALWVTAAPLDGGSRAVLHLRPGDAGDRRRRSNPHWMAGPELRVRAFGRMRVDSAEGPLGGEWLQQRPGQVLKYLVCERDRVVPAEEIAEALWPGSGRRGLNNVRHFVHQLRERLEPARPRRAPSSFIVAVRGGYAVNRRHVQIDADDFAAGAQAGLAALARRDEQTGRERLATALALYTDDFLADEPYADWAYAERDRLRTLAGRALRELARFAVIERDLTIASDLLTRLARLEPFDGDVHRDLFAVWLAEGRRTEAARGFASFRMRVLREFGEEPEFDLAGLRALIRPWS